MEYCPHRQSEQSTRTLIRSSSRVRIVAVMAPETPGHLNDRTINHTPYITSPPTMSPPINPVQSMTRPVPPIGAPAPHEPVHGRAGPMAPEVLLENGGTPPPFDQLVSEVPRDGYGVMRAPYTRGQFPKKTPTNPNTKTTMPMMLATVPTFFSSKSCAAMAGFSLVLMAVPASAASMDGPRSPGPVSVGSRALSQAFFSLCRIPLKHEFGKQYSRNSATRGPRGWTVRGALVIRSATNAGGSEFRNREGWGFGIGRVRMRAGARIFVDPSQHSWHPSSGGRMTCRFEAEGGLVG